MRSWWVVVFVAHAVVGRVRCLWAEVAAVAAEMGRPLVAPVAAAAAADGCAAADRHHHRCRRAFCSAWAAQRDRPFSPVRAGRQRRRRRRAAAAAAASATGRERSSAADGRVAGPGRPWCVWVCACVCTCVGADLYRS